MDFTRHPIIETVITPRDGFRLAVRSSKNIGQEEFSVEAVEVVSFGSSCFFRSTDRAKAFLVPVSDYEIVEIRENKIPLKAATLEGTIRIPTVKEFPRNFSKETEKKEDVVREESFKEEKKEKEEQALLSPSVKESRVDRRKEKERKRQKKRKEKEEQKPAEEASLSSEPVMSKAVPVPSAPLHEEKQAENIVEQSAPLPTFTSTIIPPPTTLIRDDLERLRKNDTYKNAFYPKGGEGKAEEKPSIPLSLQEEKEIVIKGSDAPPYEVEEDSYKATIAPLEDENRSIW